MTKLVPLLQDPRASGSTNPLGRTAVKLHGCFKEENKIEVSYRSLLRHLHSNNYKHLFPKNVPEPPDGEAWKQMNKLFLEQIKGFLANSNNDKSGYTMKVGLRDIPGPGNVGQKEGLVQLSGITLDI